MKFLEQQKLLAQIIKGNNITFNSSFEELLLALKSGFVVGEFDPFRIVNEQLFSCFTLEQLNENTGELPMKKTKEGQKLMLKVNSIKAFPENKQDYLFKHLKFGLNAQLMDTLIHFKTDKYFCIDTKIITVNDFLVAMSEYEGIFDSKLYPYDIEELSDILINFYEFDYEVNENVPN